MPNLLRSMTIAAIVLSLAGCYKGELSLGRFSPSVAKNYEISGSSYDEAFTMAHRAIEESKLEINSSSKETGQINAGIDRTTNPVQGDTRTFITHVAEFTYSLNKTEPGKLVFTVESKSSSGSEAYIDKFLENYRKYIEFREISEDGTVAEVPQAKPRPEIGGSKPDAGGQVISEIRVGSPFLPEQEYEFSKQEITQIQTILIKLGYDPGRVDGVMDDKTKDAIRKFKVENSVLKHLF